MQADCNEVLNAALSLSESDRLLIATRLMATPPEDPPGLSSDDPGFLEELARRSQDREGAIPASELWNEARP